MRPFYSGPSRSTVRVMSEQIVVLDEKKMIDRINDLPNQLEKAWANIWTRDISITGDNVDHILIAGMGGSGIAGALAEEIFIDSPVPIDVWADYGLPGYVNDKTLFITVSFSGETEETLDATKAAIDKGAKVIVITKGGKLTELATQHNLPVVTIDYDSSPREALGWLYGSILTVLTKIKIGNLNEEKYFAALTELKNVVKSQKFPVHAQELALAIANKVPMIITQSPLSAVAKRWVIQLNENSKTFAVNPVLPELCHNTLVGLDFTIAEKIHALFLDSTYAFSRNTLRKNIIKKIFDQKDIPFTPLSITSHSVLAEQWLFIYLGDLVSYFLAGVNGVDPSPVDSINLLKEELKKA